MLVAVHIVYILRPLLLLLVVIVVVLLKHSLLIPVDYIQYITHYTTTTSTSYFLMRIARSTNWGVEVCLKTIIILPDCEMLLNSVVARNIAIPRTVGFLCYPHSLKEKTTAVDY